MVRPVLEYASELWAGEISVELADKAEQVQTDFARGVLGLQGQRAISNDFVRAEMGMEMLASRWEKLRLGYWRRIQVAQPDRILSVVARMRMRQVRWGMGRVGEQSWMRGTRTLLRSRGMALDWSDPSRSSMTPKAKWKKLIYKQVEEHFEREREQRGEGLVSLARYSKVKNWDAVDADRAEFKGEVGQRGSLVVERYLDEAKDRLGRQLKLFSRAECLPLLSRVVWELGITEDKATCMMCRSNQTENLEHFMYACPAYRRQRERMVEATERAYAHGNNGASLATLPEPERTRVLLGAKAGCGLTEDLIDRDVKRYLRKAWKARRRVTQTINAEFGRQDIEWAKGGDWTNPPAKQEASEVAKEANTSTQDIVLGRQKVHVQEPRPVRRRLFA